MSADIPEELIFRLLPTDPLYEYLVNQWAQHYILMPEGGATRPQFLKATRALEMLEKARRWQVANPEKMKLPD